MSVYHMLRTMFMSQIIQIMGGKWQWGVYGIILSHSCMIFDGCWKPFRPDLLIDLFLVLCESEVQQTELCSLKNAFMTNPEMFKNMHYYYVLFFLWHLVLMEQSNCRVFSVLEQKVTCGPRVWTLWWPIHEWKWCLRLPEQFRFISIAPNKNKYHLKATVQLKPIIIQFIAIQS